MSFAGDHGPSFNLRQTNVSNPSIVVDRAASRQSLTASEDYYSLSSSASSTHTEIAPHQPDHTLQRYATPPEQYRTPLQSRDNLLLQQHASIEDIRKTPMHGEGKRRSSQGTVRDSLEVSDPIASSSRAVPVAGASIIPTNMPQRKPVPGSAAMETAHHSWLNEDDLAPPPGNTRSSMARAIDREASPPTPDDDRPYIHFALDQLTRDEEVRGSRAYGNFKEAPTTAERQALANPPIYPVPVPAPVGPTPSQTYLPYRPQADRPQADRPQSPPYQPRAEGHGLQYPRSERRQEHFDFFPPSSNRSSPTRGLDDNAVVAQPLGPPQARQPDVFLPVAPSGTPYQALNFLPMTLRIPGLGLFILLLLVYLALLIFTAIWSLTHTGIWSYGRFGDARYFVFEYLPLILGIILFLWLVQIVVAVYRITPYIALSSPSQEVRERGTRLPLFPKGFVLPYLGHFTSRQPVVGVFLVIAWLQIFTIPLLACSFNVYYYGPPQGGQWRWIATNAAIWPVIGLYALLLLASVGLMLWLRMATTGLKWDPRSLADIITLLGRSNALDSTEIDNTGAQLGYWRMSSRPNEIFHTYGISERPGRHYTLSGGRLVEQSQRASIVGHPGHPSMDRDGERSEQRNSREKMLPRPTSTSTLDSQNLPGSSLPWFLRPVVALLWVVVAVVLLVALLIVSYLPNTRVLGSFSPMVPAFVDKLGFSGTNFLYSIVPAALAMLCLLFWLDIDYAHRRLAPYAELSKSEATLGERSLLVSYPADPPFQVTLSALVNRHFQVALISLNTLIAASLPILAGGVFWSQFDIPTQRIRIYAHPPAFYALTALVTVYALSYLFILPSPPLRKACRSLPSKVLSFQDHVDLVHQSKMLDDVAFHSPASKTVLVTRLLSSAPGISAPPGQQFSFANEKQAHPAMRSSASLVADSLRGFGRARQHALSPVSYAVPKYSLGMYGGRDGREYIGIDRVRN